MQSSVSILKRQSAPLTKNKLKQLKQLNEDTKVCAYAAWIIATIFIIATAVPLLALGNASFYSDLIKYHDITQQICLGGANLTNPQITPYNTSLTYWPAQLRASTFVMHKPGQYRPVTLSYPTRFEKVFDCEPSKYDRDPCEKMVGDVISKYEQLSGVETFRCYVEGNTIVGLGSEYSNIGDQYRCSTAGIVIMVFYAIISIVCLGIYCELICYIDPVKYKQQQLPISNQDIQLESDI